MSVLTTPVGIVGLLAVFFVLFLLANLSRRLGAVTKMKPYYRAFYVAGGLMAVALVAYVLRSSVAPFLGDMATILNSPVFYLFTYYVPFGIAVTLSIAIAWRYWAWLFRETLQ